MDLNQVTVQSTDIPASIRFYQALGLTLIVEDKHYARFESPKGNATFSVELVDQAHQSNTVVYFEVDELESTVKALKEKGLVFLQDPKEESWLWHEARLKDPAGNEICIYHAGENRKNPPWRLS